MSYCTKQDNGKHKVMFLTKDDLSSPSTIKPKEDETFDPWEQHGLILPNGSINWDCPCLGGMASGPCGLVFRRAFTCFHNSDSKAKGSECFADFAALTECFSKYPKLYGSKDKDKSSSNTEQTQSATTALANVFNSQTYSLYYTCAFDCFLDIIIMANEGSYRILSSGRKVETNSSINRVLKSGRCLTNDEQQQQQPVNKKQRTLYSEIGTILHSNDYENNSRNHDSSTISSKIQVSERKPRENEPSKKLLLQAVSDANKSVLMKLNKTNGVVKVMKPDGTTECLTTKTLAKRLKAKEPTWIDPTSLINKAEPTLGKMKIRIKNEYCSTTDDDNNKSNEQHISPMEFEDDEEDEFIVVVNNTNEAGDDTTNIWMLNDYPCDDNGNNLNMNEYEEGKGNGTFKRKLSDDMMSDVNEDDQYSPPTTSLASSNKKQKRCRFWPDCHNGDQCEFVHPSQRCTHFPNCVYGSECLYIHPPCRFGSACARPDCPYLHTSVTPASSPTSTNNNNNTANTGRASITNRSESSTICKFGVQCMRPNCMYSHPRLPFPAARNYKWVNNKWHASDDISLLPPPPKNIIYENPFITDKTSINKNTNSNEDEIEK
ncbi:unnamed protein product [Adineta steineri]|uniref:Zinc finger CCCH domain-containing protein 14 n=1 Tax=Adineta steineri TaxID=433720 RepID=A0A815LPG4_9BILA|nr:unnamed protein product [Adineta steineri]CAF3624123.1 unnamed protein product [Adineta steineri]